MTKNINWKEFVKACLLIFIGLFILPIAIAFLTGFLPISENNYVTIANSIYYVILLIILIGYYHNSLMEDAKNFKKNWKKNLKTAVSYWLKAFLFMMLTNAILITILGDISMNEQANRDVMTSYPIFSIISMAFIGPFIEEMLFRKGFKKAFTKKEMFCLFTAILFGFAHIIISIDFSSMSSILNFLKQLLFIIPYGGIGYFFAKAYCETDSIFTSTLMHIFHNSLSLIIIMIGSML